MRTSLPALCITILLAPLASAQDYAPPNAKTPDKETLAAIAQKSVRLANALVVLQRQGVRDPVLADVEIYHKAADWLVRHNEFYTDQTATWVQAILDRGLLRATQASRGEAPWQHQAGQANVRAYRSRVDGSVQPYAVTYPANYGSDKTKWRLDVVLHGRDASISEVKFLFQHSGDKPAPEQPFVQVDIFGRGNNAYRWAGESDVLEAIDAFVAAERLFGRVDLLDPARVVLRGFSMGGAGTWHLGLHRPSRWAVIGPGAGFTATKGYWNQLPADLPPYVDDCLHIYDAIDYAANAADVPVVAYAGDQDPQLQAARNIIAKLGRDMPRGTLLVAPGLKHQFPPEWQKKAEAEYEKYAGPGKGRTEQPEQVNFTTYTLKYSSCDWVEILGLERHYRLSEVNAKRAENGFTVSTKSIRQLRLAVPGGDYSPVQIKIDGQQITARPAASPAGIPALYLEKRDGRWAGVLPQSIATGRLRKLQKITGLQGPIDDVFTDSFLCVRGTGTAWHDNVQKYAEADLARFQKEWDKFMRGELPVKNDVDVTDEDIASRHLILFGDPSSNSLIAHVLPGLPLKWTKETINFNGQTFDSAAHVPAMIHPSPLNAGRYVVLNSGHTFHAADFLGTNARLFPRLGDFAILKPAPTKDDPAAAEVVTAGIFDDFWMLPAK